MANNPTPLEQRKYLTRTEVDEYLSIIGQTLADKIINSPKFKGKTKIGGRVLVKLDKLEVFIENNPKI